MIWLRAVLAISSFSVLAFSCLPQNKDKGGNPKPAQVDANCGSRTSTNCATNTNCQISGTQCVGTLTYCNGYKDETSCPGSSCQWSASANSCSPIVPYTPPSDDATAGTNCGNFYQASTCPAPACVWNGVQCLASSTTTNPTTTNPTSPTTPNGGQVPPIANAACDSIGSGALAIARCLTTNGCQYYYCSIGWCDNSSRVNGCHAQGIP